MSKLRTMSLPEMREARKAFLEEYSELLEEKKAEQSAADEHLIADMFSTWGNGRISKHSLAMTTSVKNVFPQNHFEPTSVERAVMDAKAAGEKIRILFDEIQSCKIHIITSASLKSDPIKFLRAYLRTTPKRVRKLYKRRGFESC